MCMIYYVSYKNRKERDVKVEISHHAVSQFRKRWKSLYDKDIQVHDAITNIQKLFSECSKLKNLNKFEKQRVKKYGDTIYFRRNTWTFVVSNQTLVTIEISGKDLRDKN